MQKTRNAVLAVLCTACAVCLLTACVSAAQEAAAEPAAKADSPPEPERTAVVQLAVPQTITHSFFSYADTSILADLETGSPSSLRSAVSKIRKSSFDYSDTDRALLAVAGGIMQIAWPNEPVTWEIPETAGTDPYTGAVASARLGVYDTNTGKNDFLTLVLPSLVLLTVPSKTDFFAESEHDLLAALELNSRSVLAQYLLGVLYYRTHRFEQALEHFSAAREIDADCFELTYMTGMTCLALNDYADAYALGSQLLGLHPQNADALKLCAESSFALGDYDSAELFVAQVLQQEPENASYVLFRVRVLIEKRDFVRAASLLDVYGRTDRTSRDYLLLRARIQEEWNKNAAAAASTMEDALIRYPDDETVILAAARLADTANRELAGRTAAELAGRILDTDPDNLEALTVSVHAAVKEERWQDAYDTNRYLIELTSPEVPFAVSLQQVDICIALENLSEAFDIADSLYRANPSNEAACAAYIRVLAAQGRTAEALALIEDRLGQSPSQQFKSFLYYERGMMRRSGADRLSDFRQSLTANPRNADTLFQLYRYYFDQSDYRKAQYYLRQAVALNPDNQYLLSLTAELEALLAR